MWCVSHFDLSEWFRTVPTFVPKVSGRIPVIEARSGDGTHFCQFQTNQKTWMNSVELTVFP